MRHINELNLTKCFIMNDKFIAISGQKRHVVKLHSQYFSNYPLLFVVLNNKRYQVNDKHFTFECGIV